MSSEREVLRALVLQGGGALGAYELGVARALYGDYGYRPDLIAGVSIGAITAVLLARPKNGDPLATLEAFWREVTVRADWLLAPLRPYASAFGNPNFFMPRTDLWTLLSWTSLYKVDPLRQTLSELVDLGQLADRDAFPRLLVTATDVKQGQVTPFYSGDVSLSLDHILASGSLPPSFPMTPIGSEVYWDGGLFDNTPLGAVLDHMDPSPQRAAQREVVVVNLFPNLGQVPTNMSDVGQRVLNLLFANKTASDIALLQRFNAVAGLLETIRGDLQWAGLAASDAFKAADNSYIQVPAIIPITRANPAGSSDGSDFSPEGIAARAIEGKRAALEVVKPIWGPAPL